jgi:hypothetical protein
MNFEQTKSPLTAAYPVHARETSGLLRRLEPPLTPEMLRSRFLMGIPLRFPNGDEFTDLALKDRILLAMNEAETLLGRTLNREAFQDKLPFDHQLYKNYVHLLTSHGPILSIEHLAITSADQNNIFEMPPTWIETSNFSKNLINVIPLLAAFGVNSISGSSGGIASGGIALLTVCEGLSWVPSYWQVNYTAGLSSKEGEYPIIVNELIGCVATIDILSSIAPSNILNSQSQSMDGLSQASSGPGVLVYRQRIEELSTRRDTLVKKMKMIFSSRFFVGSL